jgi:DNA-directed RNA polymerase subunit omega
MMLKPPIEELLMKVENRFALCVLTSKRARQLILGAASSINVDTERVVALAIDEIYNGQVTYAEK